MDLRSSVVSVPYGGFNLPVTENFSGFFHKPFLHREGVDLGYRRAFDRRNLALVGVCISGRHIPGFTGTISSYACRISDVTSWVPDGLPELRGFESRIPDPGFGSLRWGPHVGSKATMTAKTSGIHTKLKPLLGSLDGYESPGLQVQSLVETAAGSEVGSRRQREPTHIKICYSSSVSSPSTHRLMMQYPSLLMSPEPEAPLPLAPLKAFP